MHILNGNISISIKISLKFIPKGPNNNISTLVQIMAWCRSGDNALSEPTPHDDYFTGAYMRHSASMNLYWVKLLPVPSCCDSFLDRVLLDEINNNPIFKWLPATWLRRKSIRVIILPSYRFKFKFFIVATPWPNKLGISWTNTRFLSVYLSFPVTEGWSQPMSENVTRVMDRVMEG